MSWAEIALRGLAEKRKTLLAFKKPKNWKWYPHFYKSRLKVLSISIKDTTISYEGGTMIVETGRLAPDDVCPQCGAFIEPPEPTTPPGGEAA
jgi:hypothetical protein